MALENFFDTGITDACTSCKLHKGSKTPFMEYTGQGGRKILIVSNSNSEKEDKIGRPFAGESGKFFGDELRRFGIKMKEDCWITNSVKCLPTNLKKGATDVNIKNCRHKLEKEIEDLKPIAIILLGSVAIKSLIGEHVAIASEQVLSGNCIPFNGTPVFPLFHPETILKNPSDKNMKAYFKITLRGVIDKIKEIESIGYEYKQIDIHNAVVPLTNIKIVREFFNKLMTYEFATSWDIEATGLDPNVPGHLITSFSICLEDTLKSYAIPFEHPDAPWTEEERLEITDLLRGYLESPVYKVAANKSFESKWSFVLLGVRPVNLSWCTMVTQHLIDNRPKICGLKHQAFVRYGIYGYDDAAAKYIQAAEGQDFNDMDKMPIGEQLFYVGVDSFVTMHLFLDQELEIPTREGVVFFNEAVNALTEVSQNGINVDNEYYREQWDRLTKIIDNTTEELYESQEVIKYLNTTDATDISFTSTQQIKPFLFDFLGLKSDKKTASGKMSMDEESLTKMKHWIPGHIIKLRKALKLRDTYLKGFMSKAEEGKIHPDFLLHVARSLRSSSRNPNFQNIPKRDKASAATIRKGIKPSKGRKLLEIDFSGIEVSTSALYHKDPVFVNYLLDDNSDMHRDNASDIWMLDPGDVTKMIRFYAKNCWTFPQFYGDYYGSCAETLWEHKDLIIKDDLTLLQNLKNKGITTYKKFVEHCKGVEDYMWNTRFKVYTEWKNKVNRMYQEHGFVETFFGFKFTGYLDKKQVANYPIQGTAFHILLWCLIRILEIAKKEKWESDVIGQIHDSMVFDLVPAEEHHILATIRRVCEVEVVAEFDWITVPFRIDGDISETDGDFNDMEEVIFPKAA